MKLCSKIYKDLRTPSRDLPPVTSINSNTKLQSNPEHLIPPHISTSLQHLPDSSNFTTLKMKSTLIALAAFTTLASAHFNLNYPTARGFDETKLGTFPCGSFDTPSDNRTLWPLSGGEIALTMGHIQANVEVLIGFGNNVGSAFNTVLRHTFQEQGLGNFCMTGFSLPQGMNITEGMNATIQVQTNGDPDGGLYNCADITFSGSAAGPASGVCVNGTGVSATTSTVTTSPNLTSSSTTSSSSSATTSKSAAAPINAGIGGFVLAAGAAFALVL